MTSKLPGRTAVVTAVTGGYDHIGEQKTRRDVEYFFYTNDENPEWPHGWNLRPLIDIGRDQRRQSKTPKLNPHMYEELTQFEYVIWIDGDMQITNRNFPEEILSYMNQGFVVSPHFDGRDCAYGEATIRPLKYQNEPMDEQVEFYRSEGFPEHWGLYECGVLARKMDAPGVKELGELWLEQNLTWSYQDQVSLPYCLWKTGRMVPDVLPKSFREMKWIHLNAHKSEL
jgi:O-antigen biosynthesis protein